MRGPQQWWLLLLPSNFTRMKANVYVDGFNLYYRALKRTPYKWLNLDQLCRLPDSEALRLRTSAREKIMPHGLAASFQVLVQKYSVQVRSLGGATGQSDWSDLSSHMAM